MNAIPDSAANVLIPTAGANQSGPQINGQGASGSIPGTTPLQSTGQNFQSPNGTNAISGTGGGNTSGGAVETAGEGSASSANFAQVMQALFTAGVPTEEHKGETTSGDPERGEPVSAAVDQQSELAALLVSGQIEPGEAVQMAAQVGGTTQEVPQAQQIAVGQSTASPGEVNQQTVIPQSSPGTEVGNAAGELGTQTDQAGQSGTPPEVIASRSSGQGASGQGVPEGTPAQTSQSGPGETPPGQGVSEAAKDLGEIASQQAKSISHPPETPARGSVETPSASVVQIARSVGNPPAANQPATTGNTASLPQGTENDAVQVSSLNGEERSQGSEGQGNTPTGSSGGLGSAVRAGETNTQAQSSASNETPEPVETQRAGRASTADTGQNESVVEQVSPSETTASTTRTDSGAVGPQRPQGPETPVSDQISEALRARVIRSGDEVVVRMHPPELGRVRVTFHSEGQELRAVIEAESARTLGELQREAPGLMMRLTDQGVTLRRMEFALNEQTTGNESGSGGWAEQNGQMSDRGDLAQESKGEASRYDLTDSDAETLDSPTARPLATSIEDDSINVWV